MVDFTIEPQRTALLNVDLQNVFVNGTPDGLEIVDRLNRLAAACREAGILAHDLRPDGSNVGVLGDPHGQGAGLARGRPWRTLAVISAVFGQVPTLDGALDKIHATAGA